MQNISILKIAVIGLVSAFLICIGGVIALALATPARDIPDILVATTTGILGLIGGILVPRDLPTPNEVGHLTQTVLLRVLLALALLVLVVAVVSALV